jgi:hypothetical protein
VDQNAGHDTEVVESAPVLGAATILQHALAESVRMTPAAEVLMNTSPPKVAPSGEIVGPAEAEQEIKFAVVPSHANVIVVLALGLGLI